MKFGKIKQSMWRTLLLLFAFVLGSKGLDILYDYSSYLDPNAFQANPSALIVNSTKYSFCPQSQPICSTPSWFYLGDQDRTTDVNNAIGTIWMKEKIDPTNGFESRFIYTFSADLSFPDAKMFFGVQNSAVNYVDLFGNNFGVLGGQKIAGFGLSWSNSGNTKPTISFLHTNPPPAPLSSGLGAGQFTRNNSLQALNLTVIYDTMTTPPTLMMFGDGGANLISIAVDLRNYYQENPGDTAPAARLTYVGFGASYPVIGNAFRSFITALSIRLFDPNNQLSIWCQNGFTIYINGTNQGNYQSIYTASSFNTSLTPGTLIAFSAPANAGGGCVIDPAVNSNYLIPVSGFLKCTNTLTTSWETVGFDDSAWPLASVIGNNQGYSSFVRVPNVPLTAQRYWASNSNSRTYCRFVVPRYCSASDNSNCYSNEVCSSGVCTCPPPWGGPLCNIRGIVVATSVFPSNGTSLGGTPILITGANISQGVDFCSFNQVSRPDLTTWISLNQIQCLSPAGTAGTSVSVGIRRNDNSVQTTEFTFTYTNPLTVTTVDPNRSGTSGGALVTVKGTNFANPTYCRFGTNSLSVLANVISPTQLTCIAPARSPGQVVLQITRNFVELYGNTVFTFFDPVSEYCRSFRTQVPRQEFPFVSLIQQSKGGGNFFPTNVAFNQTVTVVGSTSFSNRRQVVDEDFCCAFTSSASGQGIDCGVEFASAAETKSIQLDLPSTARVNEIIIAWAEPCFHMPITYSLSYRSGVSWVSLVNRFTTGNSSCFSIPADNGAVALCVDYFAPVDASSFLLSFDGSPSNIPSTLSGGFIYEMAVQGIFLNAPYSLLCTGVSWNTPPSFPANNLITFPSFGLDIRSILGASAASFSQVYPIQIQLFKVVNGQETDISNQLSGNTSQNFFFGATNLFSGLGFTNPQVGSYRLQFSNVNLVSTSETFQVVAGAPASLYSSFSNNRIRTALTTSIGNIQVCVQDQAGNPTRVTSALSISLSISRASVSIPFTGTSTATIPVNSNCTTFLNINLQNPIISTYTLQFNATGIQLFNILVDITEGDPSIINLITAPAASYDNNILFPNQPSLSVTDAGGNSISDLLGIQVQVSLSPLNLGVYGILRGSLRVTVSNGRATWTDLAVDGVHGESYQLTFSVVNFNVSVSTNFLIRNCDQILRRINTNTSQDGRTCLCSPGFGLAGDYLTGRCEPCAPDFYKNDISNSPCSKCPALTTTNGVPKSLGCVCQDGYYTDGSTGACIECPVGGYCKGGVLVGSLPSYWNPSQDGLTFYPCYRDNPTPKEEEAAAEACPGTEEVGSVQCGTGYTGIRCLDCAPGYGHSGPFCQKCPNPVGNYIILAIVAVGILCLLVFMVVQGKRQKNKEAVSFRILLNHIQMIALLSAAGAAWDDPFQTLLVIGSFITILDSRIVATECAAPLEYYYKYAFYLFFPLLAAVVLVVIHMIYFIFAKIKKGGEDLKKSVLAHFFLSIVIVTFLTYPAICLKILEIFDCSVKVGTNHYLNVAPSEPCSGDVYQTWFTLGIIGVIIYCAGVPGFFFILLWKYRDTASKYIELVLQFFYDGFKPQKFYWEILILGRKLLLTAVIIGARSAGPLVQIYSFLIIIQVALFLHVVFRPYVSARQFRLELWSLVALLITLGAALFVPRLEKNSPEAYAASTVVTIVNLVVIVAFIVLIIRGLWRRIGPNSYKKVSDACTKMVPAAYRQEEITSEEIKNFFDTLANNAYDKKKVLSNLEFVWKDSAPYQRRRMMEMLLELSRGTDFQNFAQLASTRSKQIELSPQSSKQSEVVEMQRVNTNLNEN